MAKFDNLVTTHMNERLFQPERLAAIVALRRTFSGAYVSAGAKVWDGERQRSLPARAETRDLGAGLGHPAYAGG